ncbi:MULTISPECIES: pantetheine-phosphate adenylyltransferase [unclassified Sporolactobacillus]|uniref:pantetheine-phosphate adenylyltransferase n=1 Tax=unclassified Sporolactobacillus TaxID=2628533 RepID=UPI0023683023|nr:pantetheine-phosphate adenylyltransferase [Sporolactobacillus sp. CQH2019]MDD9147523.1 pantetheine-phosphate adenylyltransferase [Sporolactobacillus sp. CQH2019]
MPRIAVYPGSFDPVTLGHLDIIERGSRMFDHLVVAVLNNTAKHPLFSVPERKFLLHESTKHLANVSIDSFDGLLADYLKEKNYSIILRGLRAISDFEYELQISSLNKQLNPSAETCFIMSSNKYSFLSSSIVKEVASMGAADCPLSSFVPAVSAQALRRKFNTFDGLAMRF